jgi:hypothetical protein
MNERWSRLDFSGAREGTARLAWGQRAIWEAIREAGHENAHYFNVNRVLKPPRARGPVPISAVTAAVSALVARHDALRARTFLDADGEPYQVISDAGTVPVCTVACAEEEAAKVTEALALDLSTQSFSLGEDWPVRLGVVTSDGENVSGIALTLCHMTADGYAADVAVRELRQLLLRGSITAPPSEQLLDLVQMQESGLGRDRSERAIAHWEEGYRRIPPMMFAEEIAEPSAPRWCRAFMESRALEDAVSVVAARHHMSTATVLMIAMTVLLRSFTGHEACAVTPIVHNRFRPETRDLMTTLSQLGLFILTPDPDAPLADALKDAHPEALRAYRNAQYNQQEWDRMVDRVSEDRGVRVYPSCCFNDLRPVGHGEPEGVLPGPLNAGGGASTATATLEWLPGIDHFNCDFCFTVTRQTGILAVGLTADTAKLPQSRMVDLLRGVEELIVAAAYREPLP